MNDSNDSLSFESLEPVVHSSRIKSNSRCDFLTYDDMDGAETVFNAHIWGYGVLQVCAWLKQVFCIYVQTMLIAYRFFNVDQP